MVLSSTMRWSWGKRVLAACWVLSTGACGGPADAVGRGAACFRATECSAGLVCIDRVCTNDLSSVDKRPQPANDAGKPDGENGSLDAGEVDVDTDGGSTSD
jgi:hypothetical protein